MFALAHVAFLGGGRVECRRKGEALGGWAWFGHPRRVILQLVLKIKSLFGYVCLSVTPHGVRAKSWFYT